MASSYRATRSALFFTRFRSIGAWSSPGFLVNRFACKNISQHVKPNDKHAFLVDTSALVRGFEAQGIPSKLAEAITPAITGVLNDSLANVKEEMQEIVMVQDANISKYNMVQEANLSKFKFEIQSSQEYYLSMLQSENEKLQSELSDGVSENDSTVPSVSSLEEENQEEEQQTEVLVGLENQSIWQQMREIVMFLSISTSNMVATSLAKKDKAEVQHLLLQARFFLALQRLLSPNGVLFAEDLSQHEMTRLKTT